MDIAPSVTPTTTTSASTKSPEADGDTPTLIQPVKPISFSNGVLKRHTPAAHHNSTTAIPITPVVVISYKECLKNHAASLGGHALDGCGEFMPSPTATPSDPTSLKCAACGCHRNFHRREPEDNIPPVTPTTHVIEYQPHHRHHPPPPLLGTRSPNSASPPPISSSYYPSAPHMLLALSTGISDNPNNHHHGGQIVSPGSGGSARKRFRTKFSQEQKDKMFQFAERVGWKMQKRDEGIVHEFCNEIGVGKGVLKVWMHNNKNTFSKRDGSNGGGAVNGISATAPARIPNTSGLNQIHNNMNGNNNNNNNTSNEDDEDDEHPSGNNNNGGVGRSSLQSNILNPNDHHHHYQVGGGDHLHGVTNGGSSSSS